MASPQRQGKIRSLLPFFLRVYEVLVFPEPYQHTSSDVSTSKANQSEHADLQYMHLCIILCISGRIHVKCTLYPHRKLKFPVAKFIYV